MKILFSIAFVISEDLGCFCFFFFGSWRTLFFCMVLCTHVIRIIAWMMVGKIIMNFLIIKYFYCTLKFRRSHVHSIIISWKREKKPKMKSKLFEMCFHLYYVGRVFWVLFASDFLSLIDRKIEIARNWLFIFIKKKRN